MSQGSAPLIELMAGVKASLDPLVGMPLSVTAIVDIMNKVSQSCSTVKHATLAEMQYLLCYSYYCNTPTFSVFSSRVVQAQAEVATDVPFTGRIWPVAITTRDR